MIRGRLLISSSHVRLKKHADLEFIALIKEGNRALLVQWWYRTLSLDRIHWLMSPFEHAVDAQFFMHEAN